MKFSEFVVQGRQAMMMDPLGFLSPYSALQDKLFKQFTVLSNLPAYHGLLALVYQQLADTGATPKQGTFSLQFRRAEILWGILHAIDAGTLSVLNITKYKELMRDRERIALSDIPTNDRNYLRLSYGTLGHYSSPSSTWGILGKSAQQLTERGNELAVSFGKRNGQSLRKALDGWMKGQSWDLAQLTALAVSFQAGATPDRAEAAVWRTLIEDYCDRTPATRSLWEAPLTNQQLTSWQDNPASYAAGFDMLRQRYAPLKDELTQIERFEHLVGLTQHIFEREYLACAEAGNDVLPIGALEQKLARAVRATAAGYVQMPGHCDTKGLFASLASADDYRDAAQRICAHHVAHQRSKDSIPFMEEGELRVRNKFDVGSHIERRALLASLASDAALLPAIAFQHRRDWHFQRATRYHDYAKAA